MIKRKFLFTLSVMHIVVGWMVLLTGVGTGVSSSVAVSQLSDDIVINSMARESTRSGLPVRLPQGMLLIGALGTVISFIPKKEKK